MNTHIVLIKVWQSARTVFPSKLWLLALTGTNLVFCANAAQDANVQCAPAALTLTEYYNSNSVTADPVNRCPSAQAGIDQKIMLDQSVTLNASASSDTDGQLLQFFWRRIEAPAGSGAQPENSDALKTTFVPDLAGHYVFELTVTDSDGATSVDRIRYSTGNVAPVAVAGPDMTAALGELIELDAMRSFDLDNDSMKYRWQIIEAPRLSHSQLSRSSGMRTSLTLDAKGDYVVQLVAYDGKHHSVADSVRISTVNSVPVAHAGHLRTVAPGSTLILDGSLSGDPDNDALAYHWSFLNGPNGYKANMTESYAASPQIKLGEAGLYLFQLIVDDGVWVSEPATVLIDVQANRLADFDLNNFLSLTNAGGGDDTDGDGVLDPVDNCVLVANAPQRDTDGDGIGNFCDGDFNNDGVVNFADISAWTPFFLSTDPDSDLNGDGNVNFGDYAILVSYFLKQPGPVGTIVWVSLVDGDWDDRLNWEPQIIPSAGTTAIIDVVPAVTVTLTGGNTMVKNLVQNETLVLSSATFEATGMVELGGNISASFETLNNTTLVPSLAGSGTMTLNSGAHTWSNNTLGVNVTLDNGALVTNSNGLTVNAITSIDAPTSPTGFQFPSDQTVDGAGTIVINGAGNSQITEPRLLPSTSTTLTLAAGLTIRGGNGTIGQSFANLVMNANVVADVGSDTLSIGGSLWTGNGTLTAINGGGHQLFGSFDNAGATLNLDTAGGSINLLAGAALRNAVINGQAGTDLTINTGTTVFENLVFNADLNMVNGALTNVTSGLTLNGNAFIDAPTSPTGFNFLNSQTLGGTGTITLDGVGNSQISEPRLLPTTATTLTIAPGITIRGGKGTIGQLFATLILGNDVIADVSGESLQIAGATWSSTGNLIAINGGALLLSGNFDNGGSSVGLDTGDGSVNLLAGAALRNATVNGQAGTNITVNSGTTTLDTLVFNGDIRMVNGALSNVFGGLTINGTLLITAPSSPTGLQFVESQTLSGNLEVVIDGTGNSVSSEPRLRPSTSTTLTVGAEVTIRGGNGTIGQNFANLVMLGDLIADQVGEELLIGGAIWSANSTIQATNDGEVRFIGGFNNGGNPLSLDAANGVVELLAGATLANGTLNGTAGTNLLVRTGTTSLTAMTLNHDLTHENGALSNVRGGLTINGTSTIVAPSSPTGYQFIESQSLLGTAVIVFDSAANGVITEPRLLPSTATTLTIGPNISIGGSKGTVGQNFASVVMNGAINASVSGEPIAVQGGPWSGTGSLSATNGGVLRIGGTLNNADQTLLFDTAGGSIEMLSGSALRNATLTGTAGTNFGFNSGTHTLQDLTVTADLTMNNGALANVTDGLTLNGTALISAPSSPTGFQFINDQTLDGAATIVFDGVGNSVITEPRMLPSTSTTLTIASTVAIRGGIGTLGQQFANVILEGTVSADVDTLNLLSVNIRNLVEGINGANLSIDNQIVGPGAEFHAGADSVITFLDPLALNSGHSVSLDIAGPLSFGRLNAATSTANYDGTITISAVGGYTPNLGDQFTIITHGVSAGAFSTVNSVGLGGGQSFGLTYNPLDVIATVN